MGTCVGRACRSFKVLGGRKRSAVVLLHTVIDRLAGVGFLSERKELSDSRCTAKRDLILKRILEECGLVTVRSMPVVDDICVAQVSDVS